MKCSIIIDKQREEEVMIYAHEKTKLIEEIENLVSGELNELIGYIDREAVKISLNEVVCFVVENNKVYALIQNGKFCLKQRLYQLESMQDKNFIKINQSCIANVRMIRRFDASLSGSLKVTFRNGYVDYVSRRNLKTVKERLGL